MFANAQTVGCAAAILARQSHSPGHAMSWSHIESDWARFRDVIKQQWTRLTDAHLDDIAGRREQLIGKIRSLYGISQEQTEKQVTAWVKRVQGPQPPV
jgi:uncharacterized protein YjbJ (UPF0337 family)